MLAYSRIRDVTMAYFSMMRFAQGFSRACVVLRISVFGGAYMRYVLRPSPETNKPSPVATRDDRRHKVNFTNNRYFSIYYNKSVHVSMLLAHLSAHFPLPILQFNRCVCALRFGRVQRVLHHLLDTTTPRQQRVFVFTSTQLHLSFFFTNSTLSRPPSLRPSFSPQ